MFQMPGSKSKPPARSAVAAAVAAAISIPVRQTVLSGPVDAAGLPSFGGATGGTTVTIAGTLIAAAANGFSATLGAVDRVGSATNTVFGSGSPAANAALSTNGTMYLGYTVNSDGTMTPFTTTLAPTYRWGGADVVTANQRTFNIQEMSMKVGNGATAAQSYDVFVGEVTVAGNVVTVITWYALMGRYRSATTATLPAAGTQTSLAHNLGVIPATTRLIITNITGENGYVTGEQLGEYITNSGAIGYPFSQLRATKVSMSFGVGNTAAWAMIPAAGGVGAGLTLANWSYRGEADRGW